jgi:hypothetical protein
MDWDTLYLSTLETDQTDTAAIPEVADTDQTSGVLVFFEWDRADLAEYYMSPGDGGDSPMGADDLRNRRVEIVLR